jgi:hypothetical protein
MLWWESFFRSITIMTIIFALTVLWTMATPTIHGAWLDPAAGVAPRTHTAPAADRESDDDGAVVGLVSPDDDSVVAAPSSGITYLGDDPEELGDLVLQALSRVGVETLHDFGDGDLMVAYDDSVLVFHCLPGAMKVDHLIVECWVPLVPAAYSEDPRLQTLVRNLSDGSLIGRVGVQQFPDREELALSISRFLSFQDHLTDQFLTDWLDEFEASCDRFLREHWEELEMWVNVRWNDEDEDEDEDEEMGEDEGNAGAPEGVKGVGAGDRAPAEDPSKPLTEAIDDIRILPAENRGVWDEGPFPLRVVGEEFSHCINEQNIMGVYRTVEFGGWPGWNGIAMAGPDDQNNPDYARTCEQWVAFGAEPRDNMNNKIGQTMKAAEATLSFLMVAQPSPHSRLANQDLRRILLPLVPPPVERERLERSPDPINSVSLRGASLGRTTECWRAHAELRAFGDVDGDGWEDMLIERYDGATRATYSETQLLTYTMHESGHPIPLWNRVPQYMPSAEAWAARKARWAANLGLPVDRPIELRGTCSCHLDQEQHAMTLVVQARHGILEGWKTCERVPQRVVMLGSLAEESGALLEYGIDDLPTAQWFFGWELKDGRLEFYGGRCNAGGMEQDDFQVAGGVEEVR